MGIAIPDLSDGLAPAIRRLLETLAQQAYQPEHCSPLDRPIATWRPIHAARLADPSTSVTDLFAGLLRLTKDWGIRYPLVETWFSWNPDPPPEMVRLTRTGKSLLLRNWICFPNLLCNGAWAHSGTWLPEGRSEIPDQELEKHLCDQVPSGPIRGGEALSFLPPHNLAEVGRGLLLLLDHPDAPLEEILRCIPGPDFPTGAILLNPQALPTLYRTGEGTLTLGARMEVDESGVAILEIPDGLARTTAIEQLTLKVRSGVLHGISDVLDRTEPTPAKIRGLHNEYSDIPVAGDRNPVKIQLGVKPGTDPSQVKEQLLRESCLQRAIPVQMKVTDQGNIRRVGLQALLSGWLGRARNDLSRESDSRAKELIRLQIERWISNSDPRRTTIGA